MSLMDMHLESVSEETASSDESEPMSVVMSYPFGLFGATGPATTSAYVAPPSRDPSCRLGLAAFSPVISATSAGRGAVPVLDVGRLVAVSDESPELVSSLPLHFHTSCADDRWEMWVPPPGVVLRFPAGTTDFLFWFNVIPFLISLMRAGRTPMSR
jgi:hypothetical protein